MLRQTTGVTTYAHRAGLGPTLVCVHALGTAGALWNPMIAHLPRGRGVLHYDLPGHGLSEGVADGIEAMADGLIDLVERLDLAPAVPCGISIGGQVALAALAKRPDLFVAGVLIATAPRIGSPEGWAERAALVQAQGLPGATEAIVPRWFAPGFAKAEPDRTAMAATMLRRCSPEGYLAACAALAAGDLWAVAPSVEVPVLCLAGMHDGSVPILDMERLAETLPNGRIETFDTGHLPPLEVPEGVAASITDFLRGLDADPALRVRRSVLGDAHVDRAEAARSPLTDPFRDLIHAGAWGRVWASDAIAPRDRSMLTLALLAALGNWDEVAMHVRACAQTGATEADMREAMQHVAIYAGVPRANHALKIIARTLAEDAP